MTDREAMAKAIMGYDLAELSTVYPGDEHNWQNALKAADRVIALAPEWEFGASWLEGEERVYRLMEDEWSAERAVHQASLGYPFPEENYIVRRHPASAWEPLSPGYVPTEETK